MGNKVEDKGLRASRDSDKAVREAYFNAADRANSLGSSGSAKAKHGKVNADAGASHWARHAAQQTEHFPPGLQPSAAPLSQVQKLEGCSSPLFRPELCWHLNACGQSSACCCTTLHALTALCPAAGEERQLV